MNTLKTFAWGLAITACFVIAGLLGATAAKADSYDEMFDAVDWLAKKYGVVAYTTYGPLEDGLYAETTGDTIVFNSMYVNNPDQLHADMVSDVMTGYHPGLFCSPEQVLAAHEFAHVLDYLSGYTANDELEQALANGLNGTVSGYSMESTNEALAEAFTAVECDTPNAVETAMYDMLVN